MFPWRSALAALVVIGIVTAAVIAAPRETFLGRQVQPVVAAAAFVKMETATGHGSGVHIGGGYILTAAHVVKDASEITVRSSLNETQTGQVLWTNTKYDIALVLVEQPMASVNLSCRVAQVGEEIRAVGNPLNIGAATSWGRIAGDIRRDENSKWAAAYVVDMTIVMGQSGGAVLDKNNEVVGIAVGVYLASLGFSASLTGFAAVVPSSTVCQLMGRTE